jgi:hypothetical protein
MQEYVAMVESMNPDQGAGDQTGLWRVVVYRYKARIETRWI